MHFNKYFKNVPVFVISFSFVALMKVSNAAPEENTILIGLAFKNNEIYLPYFLSFLHRLSFPKNRISLLITLGKSKDRTPDIVNLWLERYGEEYGNFDIWDRNEDWDMRNINEEILIRAREMKVDYFMILDPSAFIIEKDTIQHLMSKERIIVAGMLRSPGMYSNFWGAIAEDLTYVRSHQYKILYTRENHGCFRVPLVYSCVLIDLRIKGSHYLSFMGPDSYPVAFAVNALAEDIPIFVCNDKLFGFVIPYYAASDDLNVEHDIDRTKEVKDLVNEITQTLDPLEIFISAGFVTYPAIDNLGMDRIYVINLLERPQRKKVMEERLKEAGLEAHFFEAVHGTKLNSSYLMSIGANQLKSYDDIFMNLGQIGSFLSQYFIWKDVIKNKFEKVLILEDDVELILEFPKIVKGAVKELIEKDMEWDYLFCCRGIPLGPLGDKVEDSEYLQEVGYGMLSVNGYVLNLSGAQKLVTSISLSELIPIDEYILYMHSPQYREFRDWKHNFGPCNLKVYFVDPQPAFSVPFRNDSMKLSDTLLTPRTNDETFGMPIGLKLPRGPTDEL